MGSDNMIRYSAVLDKNGQKVSGGYRAGLDPLLSDEEQKMELYHAGQRWESRKNLIHKIGKAQFSLTEYDKIKRIAFPVDKKHLLLVSAEREADHNNIIGTIRNLILQNDSS